MCCTKRSVRPRFFSCWLVATCSVLTARAPLPKPSAAATLNRAPILYLSPSAAAPAATRLPPSAFHLLPSILHLSISLSQTHRFLGLLHGVIEAIFITARVPAECLINSARYVCKPWATLIASSHFADAHVRHAHASSSQLISLVVADFAMTTEKYCLYSLYTKDKYRTDFRLPTRMMRYSALVNSCDGIMLMLCFDDTTGCFVVNPVLKCWLSLPPLPAPIDLVCDSDLAIVRVPRSTAKFKVFLLIPNVVYVLTIGIDISWREIYRKEANVSIDFYHAVCSGANDLYWIRRDGVTGIDIDKEIITWKYPLPSLPNGFFVNYLCMGNHLSCVLNLNQNTKTSFGKAKIYILDTDIGKWSLFHEMGPFDFVPAFDCEHYDAIVSRFCFWIKEQLIFRASLNPIRKEGEEEIKGHDRYVYFSYNVKTRKATKIEGIDENLRHMYLHTSSLVSLPTTLT